MKLLIFIVLLVADAYAFIGQDCSQNNTICSNGTYGNPIEQECCGTATKDETYKLTEEEETAGAINLALKDKPRTVCNGFLEKYYIEYVTTPNEELYEEFPDGIKSGKAAYSFVCLNPKGGGETGAIKLAASFLLLLGYAIS